MWKKQTLHGKMKAAYACMEVCVQASVNEDLRQDQEVLVKLDAGILQLQGDLKAVRTISMLI